jgi:FAD-dependent oxidoreductase domain-containing protein 1
VAIIGGGVSGALCATRLAQRGFEVSLLEKAGIGNGSSSRSMAGIRAQFGAEQTVVSMLFSEWWYANFHDVLATPPALRQPVLRQNGYLFVYDDPHAATAPPDAAEHWERAKATLSMQRRVGVAVELLDIAEIRYRWPHLATERLCGATWCPTDGFLYPAVIYGEGVRRAEELGARILQRTAVLGARCQAGRILALETTRGLVEADWIINCTNAWAARVSPLLGGMDLPIDPVKRFLYHIDPGPVALSAEQWQRLPMTIYGMGRPLGAHTRPEGAHLVMAGMSDVPPEPDFADDDQDLVPAHFDHRHGVDNFGYQLFAEVAEYSPGLVESGGLIATTCGYYGMTPDHQPLIGFDRNLRNLVHAAGFSGHGVMHAPITAVLVEALVTGEAVDGQVRLPEPFAARRLDLGTFDPCRDFSRSTTEPAVL